MKCAWCRKRVWWWQDKSRTVRRLEWDKKIEHTACYNTRNRILTRVKLPPKKTSKAKTA